jgi:hypothetical protein
VQNLSVTNKKIVRLCFYEMDFKCSTTKHLWRNKENKIFCGFITEAFLVIFFVMQKRCKQPGANPITLFKT